MASPRLYLTSRRWFGTGRFLARRPHDPDFRFFRRYRESEGLFLDVGANSGNSALSYRLFDHSSKIVSLEPNPAHVPDLEIVKRLIGEKFEYRIQAAAEQRDSVTLFIPKYRGVPLTGEASFHRDEAETNWTAKQLGLSFDRLELDEVDVPVHTVDELGLSPHAVKIDVQGAELGVLKGMQATLRRTHPLLLVENSEHTPEISRFLSTFEYKPYWYDPQEDVLAPYDGRATTNVFYMAREASSAAQTC